ncbi:MAG: prefoldin subunit alpha [Candidatus Thorarchaeota archaeon]
MSNEITNEIVTKIRTLQYEIDQVQLQLSAIEQQLNLTARAIDSINDAIKIQEELKHAKSGDEILVPIGGSNLILCTVKDPDTAFVSIGSGINLQISRDLSEEKNKNQVTSLEQSVKQLQSNYFQFAQALEGRRQELIQLAQKYQIVM